MYSYGVKIAGHSFYVLGLRDTGVTLAYDATSGTWARWTSLTARASVMHHCANWRRGNDHVGIARTVRRRSCRDIRRRSECLQRAAAGAIPTANTLAFDVPAATTSPATGTIVATGYDEAISNIRAMWPRPGVTWCCTKRPANCAKFRRRDDADNGAPIFFRAHRQATTATSSRNRWHRCASSDSSRAARQWCGGPMTTT